ncbi:MAG: biotin synthase BioB [Planctomycetota bacterium]|jgi:biotin synthase|nr:biotin synthase BioB [Planctomycetota bacterium]
MQASLRNIIASRIGQEKFSPVRAEELTGIEEMDVLDLMAAARLAVSSHGVKPFTCGILNVKSGQCSEDCVFCAQSGHYNTNVNSYPLLTTQEILDRVERLRSFNLKYLGLVTSGASLTRGEFTQLLESLKALKARFNAKICASLGHIDAEMGAELKAIGLTSYHHNLEGSPGFFDKICSTHSQEGRIDTVKKARESGLRVCSGGIFGLGETWQDRLEFAAVLAELDVDAIPINFLRPVAGTPAGERSPLPARDALKIIALFRLMNPSRDIHICGGRELTLGSLKGMVFAAGANGIMVGDYLTYPGSDYQSDQAEMEVLGLS